MRATFDDLIGDAGRASVRPRWRALCPLTIAAKSNASYNTYKQACTSVAMDKSRPVPEHLHNSPIKLMKKLGYGKLYRYPHDEPEAFVSGETYLPDNMPDPHFYQSIPRGWKARSEMKIAHLCALDQEVKKLEK